MSKNYSMTRWRTSRLLSFLVFALGLVTFVFTSKGTQAQISYNAPFTTNISGWTITNFGAHFTGATACGGSGGALRVNLYSGATTSNFTSPSLGTSTGGLTTLSLDYKVANWSANTTGTANTWGSAQIQWSQNGTTWNTLFTINSTNHVVSGNCATIGGLTFTPTAGLPLFVRVAATWSAGDYYFNVDNVVVNETPPPSCSTVTAGGTVSPSSLTACPGNSFTLNVTGATADNPGGLTFQWQSSTNGVDFTNISGQTGASLTTSITSATWFRRLTICAAGSSELPSTAVEVNVSPALSVPTAVENFTATTLPSCWSTALVTGTTNWGSQVGTTDNDGVPSGRGGVGRFLGKAWNNSDALAVSPQLDFSTATAGSMRVNVWIYRNTLNAASDRIRVHINTAPNLTGATQLLEVFPNTTVAPTVPSAGWYNYTANIPASFTGIAHIIVQGTTSAGFSSYGIGIDDLAVEAIPSCLQPSALTASSIATTSASLSWTAGGTETAWNVQYGPAGFTLGSGTIVSATNPFTLGSLTAETSYDYYVQADCGGSGTSSWAGPFSFITDCDAATLPYNVGFNTATAPACFASNVLVDGDGDFAGSPAITYVTTGASPFIAAPFEGTRMVRFNSFDCDAGDQIRLVTKEISTTGVASVNVSYRWHTDPGFSGALDNVQVQWSTDGTTWTNAGSPVNRFSATTGWTLQELTLPSGAGNQATLFIGLLFTSDFGNNCHLDDLRVFETPACPQPTAGAVSNITSGSVDVNWTEAGTASNWDIEYGTTGFTQGLGILIEDILALPYNLSGLSANTTYQFYYRSDCGATQSDWSGPVSFTTLCDAVNVPYTENFESAVVPGMPACSFVLNVNGGSTWTTVNNPGAGFTSNTLRYSWNTTLPGNDWWFSGGINLVGGTSYTLTYNYGNNSTFFTELLNVRYGTSASPAGMTEVVANHTVNQNAIQTNTFTFTPTSSGVYYLGFQAASIPNQFSLYVDNIALNLTPTCGAPSVSGVTPSFDAVSFTINASTIGTPVGYEYEIVADGVTPTGTGTSSATNTITAGGLTPVTPYDLYVRTDCGGGDFSAWVGPISFTTTVAPPANFNCANAIPISCATPLVSGTTVGALLDPNYIDAGAGGTAPQRGVWYTIVGDDNAYTINTCSAIGFDSRISVYSGSCGALAPVTGNDDMSPECSVGEFLFRSEVTFNALAGTTYYVYVHNWTQFSTPGPFELNISCSTVCPAPANDACASAQVLTQDVTCSPVSGTTVCATNTPGLANPGGADFFATMNDVWYQFTASAADGYILFDNVTAEGLYYTIYFEDPCGGSEDGESGVQDFVVPGEQILFIGAVIGDTYWLRVHIDPTVPGAVDGEFDLCVVARPCATPVNADAVATSATNVEVTHDGVDGDTYIIEYGPVGFTPGEAGTAGVNGTIVSSTTLVTNVTVAPGTYQFFVRKDCSGSAEGYSLNQFAGQVTTPPANDNCANAQAITCGSSVTGTTVAATTSTGETTAGVWYSIVGDGSTISASTCGGATWNTFLQVYTGPCGGPYTSIASNDNACGNQSTVSWLSTVGETYYVLVRGVGTANGTFTLTTTCQNICTTIQNPGSVLGPNTICAGVSFTLNATNINVGTVYQWQRRTAGTNWANIAGATSSSLTTSQTVATEYRVRIGCNSSGLNSISSVLAVAMTPFLDCFCTPTTGSNTSGDFIAALNFGSISNNSGVNPSVYTSYTAAQHTTTILRGGQHSGTFTVGTWSTNNVGIWIDFNRDGTFQSTERVYNNTDNLAGNSTTPFTVNVPVNASLGTTKMRIRKNDDFNGGPTIDPCAAYSWTETEDYVITIANGSVNDSRANATVVNPANFPSCSNLSGNLANATPSATGEGNDLWYSFTAESNGVRIQLTGSGDNLIELEDAAGNTIETQNTAGGSEILANGSLTPGAQYFVAVRNVTGPASFTVCIQTLAQSTCDNGPVFTSLCNVFKADWTGTANYVATFTETAAPFNVYVGNLNGTTSLPLRNVAGLAHGRSYNVRVDAVYTIGSETITVQGDGLCTITITQHPFTNLRTIDAAPNTRTIGAFIGTDVLICGNTDYEWSFELVDELNNPIGIEGPVSVFTGSNSRYIRTSQIPGVSAGNRYRVRVRPIFGAEPGVFDDGTFRYLQITSSAGMVDAFDGEVAPEAVLFERNTENGVFAALYPNPNNGDMVNLNIAGLDSESVQVRIFDATGRVVFSNRYVVEGALNTIVSFDNPLTSGMYIVEMTFGKEVITERMMVSK